jgi:pyruvate formate lyase activating enzyme
MWTAPELVDVLARDAIFYEQSGGGITCSGGEPLHQAAFCSNVLRRCQERGIHTAVDTCGYADEAALQDVAEHTDLFLYDVKLMDDDRHRRMTGVSNAIVLENLQRLDRRGARLWIRMPLIPGINDDEGNLLDLAALVRGLACVEAVQVLPYHPGGEEKRVGLGRKRTALLPIDADRASAAADRAVRLLAERIDVPVTKGG